MRILKKDAQEFSQLFLTILQNTFSSASLKDKRMIRFPISSSSSFTSPSKSSSTSVNLINDLFQGECSYITELDLSYLKKTRFSKKNWFFFLKFSGVKIVNLSLCVTRISSSSHSTYKIVKTSSNAWTICSKRSFSRTTISIIVVSAIRNKTPLVICVSLVFRLFSIFNSCVLFMIERLGARKNLGIDFSFEKYFDQ